VVGPFPFAAADGEVEAFPFAAADWKVAVEALGPAGTYSKEAQEVLFLAYRAA